MTVMCPSNSNEGGPVSIFPSSLQQITCSGFELSTGMAYTTGSSACTEGMILRSATNPSCGNVCCWIFRILVCCDRELSLKCDRQFASGTQDQCVENSCAPLNMGTSITGVTCSPDLVLTTTTTRSCTY